MSRLAIFGTGGMGREIFDIADMAGISCVFVVDNPSGPVLGVPTIHPDQLEPGDQLVIGLGSSEHRRALAGRSAGRAFTSVKALTIPSPKFRTIASLATS